jgi:hypothetical protein
MSIYEEAEQSYRDQCRSEDSDRKWAEREEQDERQAKYLSDAKLGLI